MRELKAADNNRSGAAPGPSQIVHLQVQPATSPISTPARIAGKVSQGIPTGDLHLSPANWMSLA
jgi:hypothetical protein